ncbi:MAG: L,D-transpeptidase family protein [Alphaproteobacteria bacterium]|nr:L,D-transpeptidase family protein [Alphaproteobacteria bacterium]MDE2336715.1 L,D-transpeptidase family protein [Alphaproteobacteria bacterium]
MRKVFARSLTVALLFAGAMPARASIFSIDAFKMPDIAAVVLPQPRPANLVPAAPVTQVAPPVKEAAAQKGPLNAEPAKAAAVKAPANADAQKLAANADAQKLAANAAVQKTASGKNGKTAKGAAKGAVSKNSPFYNPDADPPPIIDVDETLPLPPYPPHAVVTVGKLKTYTLGEQDTLLDVARYFNIGFVEMRAANPGVDAWTPVPGSSVVIPSFKLIPRTAHQDGIVVNLAQMRLFYFRTPGRPPVTFPIGIGRDGLSTPLGHTTIIRKQADPYWYPTPRMRMEEPFLPAAVPPGPDNPLGAFALYLGWPEYRIHGTNLPWAVGRSVSSGCMRMYAPDIAALYRMVPVGTHVTVVDQPILVGWVGPKLYLEADPTKTQGLDIEIGGTHKIKPLTPGLKKTIIAAAGQGADKIDWAVAERVVAERLGYPVMIANLKGHVAPLPHKEPRRIAGQSRHDMLVPSAVTRYDFNQ